MHRMLRIVCLFVLGLSTCRAEAHFALPSSCRQCILGIAPDWNSSSVTLSFFERASAQQPWQLTLKPWTARIGKNGLVWGLGLHPLARNASIKREGDGRAPAGVFSLGDAWGHAASIAKQPSMRYHIVTTRDLWIDDPQSPLYNHHYKLGHEPISAWELKQQMKQNDPAHALKLFIAHNASPPIQPGRGSAIFFHIWRRDGLAASAGCTTMAPAMLATMIRRLDPQQQPLYVLLPAGEYQARKNAWKLP